MIVCRKNILILLFTLITSGAFTQQSPNADFIFPIDINPSVSGSFAELRSNHFHSGIDLSTNGKVGIAVKSMEKGIVSRIKISPVGYGNAIYIKHNNGYTTVYGHLRNYSAKIDSIISAQQYVKESFAIDYFPKEEIAIAKAEIIGFSGNSGSSGGPHLHYEIRDTKTEEPINPYFFQNIIKDNVRPKLLTIRLYPMDSNSTINEKNSAKNYPVVFYDGAYHLKGNPKIYASGKIGVAIEMLDYMSNSWRKCGVYKLNMTVNDQIVYGWELARFSFNESRYINSHVDYAYKVDHGKRFERCFRQPGNHLRIYVQVKDDGIVSMDSSKTINIKAFDAANNLANLNLSLLKGKDITVQHPMKQVKLSIYKAHNLHAKGGQCYIPKGALYEDAEIEFKTKTNINNQVIYQVGNKNIPLHKQMNLSFAIPDSLKILGTSVCLANINDNGKRYYAGGHIKKDSMLISTKNFGNFTFAIDTIPPTIRALQNIRGRVFATNAKFVFKISDNFSGINSYNGYLNNKWTLFEYDAKSNKLTCPLSKAPIEKGGKYDLKLIITDNCGNQKVLKSNFQVAK